MIDLMKRWAAVGCLSGACLWSLGCGGQPSGGTPAPSPAPQTSSGTDHNHDHADSTETPAETPQTGDAAPVPNESTPPSPATPPAPAGGGSNINFGDL